MKKFVSLLTLIAIVMTIPLGAASAEDAGLTETATTPEELEEMIDAHVQATIDELTAGYDALVDEIDTYDKYIENTDKIEDFYDSVLSATEALCIDLRAYSVDYARFILASDEEIDDKCDELYDWIYYEILDDGCQDVYDDIFDYVLEDMYYAFYDGVIYDAHGDVPYSDWFGAGSAEFSNWSDAYSDVLGEWSDCYSDIFSFCSDLMSELMQEDIEGAQDKTDDFQNDVEELAEEAGHNIIWYVPTTTGDGYTAGADIGDAAITEEADATAPPVPTATPTETDTSSAVTDEVAMKR